MDYVIHSMGMPFNGNTVNTKSLGGSESAAYYLARELAHRGHSVKVWTGEQEEGTWDGVQYLHFGNVTPQAPLGERFTYYALNTPHDVLIIQRHPLGFHKDWASKVNVLQLHDLALFRSAGMMMAGAPRVDMITGVSQWHVDQIKSVYAGDDRAYCVVPNGVDPALYAGARDDDGFPASYLEAVGKNPGNMRLLYQSRPERGLEHLVRPGGIMDRLRNLPVTLLVCGYENTTEQMAPYYQQLAEWAKALPNVEHIGALTKPELACVQRACDALVYPTEFEEVSCITVMEAMHAHLPVVTSHCAALPETCREAGIELIPLKDGKADEDAFVEWLMMVEADLHNPDRERASVLGAMCEAQRRAATTRTWAHATEALEAHVAMSLNQRHSSKGAVMRHCIEHSDIGFLDWYIDSRYIEPEDAIAEASIRERIEMFGFIENPTAHIAHYEQWEGFNLDNMAAQGRTVERDIDGFATTPRFRAIAQEVAKVVGLCAEEGRTAKIFEFGCAHGHVLIKLAQLFPDAEFIGMDFMGRSINLMMEAAKKLGVGNVKGMVGSIEDIETTANVFGKVDAVIAAEVIEHIYDYHGALNELAKLVKPDGVIIITTPTGRWEWSGHEWFPKGREHLHHFEKQDWRDICGDLPHGFLFAPASSEETGGERGSWIITVQMTGKAFGVVNYERKLRELACRETLSLCMIVKDAESTIRKALLSVIEYVDEVVLCIDPSTKDDTLGVIKRIQEAYPYKSWVVTDGKKALEEGFDAARNYSVALAQGDWIMWMDADEEVPQAYNAWRLLRPSCFNAYGCPQIHYSVQPAQVISTDFPSRLFRNGRGSKFYGLVHEHPEDVPGTGIKHMSLATDIQFLHAGYVDEKTRRARYHRNLPLLMKDLEANPDRMLNKFLMLRDIAQGIQFDAQSGQADAATAHAQARKGVELYLALLDTEHLRMILDALPYYSVCNEVLGQGFVGKLTWETNRPPFDQMSSKGSFEGKFADRATWLKLCDRIAQETTKHYESRYA